MVESADRLGFAEVGALAERFESASAEALLEWALERYGSRLVIASSFGVEDVALIDLARRIDASVRVITLDTGRLHQETYDTIARVRDEMGVRVEVYAPERAALEELVTRDGPNGFYDSIAQRRACCGVRKLEGLKRALSTADAWATGLRRDQNVTRAQTAKVELDLMHGGVLKLNPLADWTSERVWAHVRDHELPYNPLHDRGFPSIGCAPCTRAVAPGEDERSGRWWWENPTSKECGLHPARHDDNEDRS